MLRKEVEKAKKLLIKELTQPWGAAIARAGYVTTLAFYNNYHRTMGFKFYSSGGL